MCMEGPVPKVGKTGRARIVNGSCKLTHLSRHRKLVNAFNFEIDIISNRGHYDFVWVVGTLCLDGKRKFPTVTSSASDYNLSKPER